MASARVVVGRAARRAARQEQFEREFGAAAEASLDLVELTELAWHDCYGETEIPAEVLADLVVLAEGDLGTLVSAARLAVADRRDLRVAADAQRVRQIR